MNSGRLVFDSSVVHRGSGGAQMLLFGGGSAIFRGARSALAMDDGHGKRPFFTTHDDVIEEEYYDEQLPEKKRRLTPEQVRMLEGSFEAENKLEPERKSELARQLGLAPRQVAVWFQNRRARWKTKQLEQDFDRLKSSYDALLADRDSLATDNDRLRAQVILLTEKLQAKESSARAAVVFGLDTDEQTSVSETVVGAAAAAAATAVELKAEDRLSADTNGSAVLDTEGTHHSCESYFTNEGYCYVDPHADVGAHSEEDDGGTVSDEGGSFFPGAMFSAAAAGHGSQVGYDEAAQFGNWWFWST